jgi:predicted nucleic acid-binding protein
MSSMNTTRKYMVDTNIFNWLVQRDLLTNDLPSDGEFVATAVQKAELGATSNSQKRAALFAKFSQVVTDLHSAPLAFDVPGAGFNQGRFTNGKLASAITDDLDKKEKKDNNIQDALIAETAITNGSTLLTCDRALKEVAEAHVCRVLFFENAIAVAARQKP